MQSLLEEKEEKNSLIEECEDGKDQLRDRYEEDIQSLLEEKEEKNSLIKECEDGKDQLRDRYEEDIQSLLEEKEEKNSLIEECEDGKDQLRDRYEEDIQSLLDEKEGLMGQIAELTKSAGLYKSADELGSYISARIGTKMAHQLMTLYQVLLTSFIQRSIGSDVYIVGNFSVWLLLLVLIHSSTDNLLDHHFMWAGY